MKAAVVTFPGSNGDRDLRVALARVTGRQPLALWHGETTLPTLDVIALPGGFSYGDYLRCGAMSAKSAIMGEIVRAAQRGVVVIGICNGFQILTEAGLLPGALMRNARLAFICADVSLTLDRRDTAFTGAYGSASTVLPVAHHDGNYRLDKEGLARLEGEGQVLFRYAADINGSVNRIAAIQNKKGNVLGMMPHPERAVDPIHGSTGGVDFFRSLAYHIGGRP